MDAGHINISYIDLMADRRSFNFVCCVLCILISAKSLGVDATDNSLRHGTCDIEEGEDGFCDSEDENMYLENIEISDLKNTEACLQNKEDVEISSESSLAEKPRNEDDNSLSEVVDKQIHVINNSTNEWLGLQIPVVDGVRVSVSFLFDFLLNSLYYMYFYEFLAFSNVITIFFFAQPPTQIKYWTPRAILPELA